MTTTYAQLVTDVSDTVENEFTTEQINRFIALAEQSIYNTVQIPALRKQDTSVATVDGTDTITLPSDFLFMYSFAVVKATGEYVYLLDKDPNFIREAYPIKLDKGTPKHYGILNATTLILGPTPDAVYTTELQYGHYPESIVIAGTTWLGTEFDSALFNATLLEAARFLKLEPDTIEVYTTMYTQSMQQLRNLGAGKLKQDMYRAGETRVDVK